jgi:hypothetical protein
MYACELMCALSFVSLDLHAPLRRIARTSSSSCQKHASCHIMNEDIFYYTHIQSFIRFIHHFMYKLFCITYDLCVMLKIPCAVADQSLMYMWSHAKPGDPA